MFKIFSKPKKIDEEAAGIFINVGVGFLLLTTQGIKYANRDLYVILDFLEEYINKVPKKDYVSMGEAIDNLDSGYYSECIEKQKNIFKTYFDLYEDNSQIVFVYLKGIKDLVNKNTKKLILQLIGEVMLSTQENNINLSTDDIDDIVDEAIAMLGAEHLVEALDDSSRRHRIRDLMGLSENALETQVREYRK